MCDKELYIRGYIRNTKWILLNSSNTFQIPEASFIHSICKIKNLTCIDFPGNAAHVANGEVSDYPENRFQFSPLFQIASYKRFKSLI